MKRINDYYVRDIELIEKIKSISLINAEVIKVTTGYYYNLYEYERVWTNYFYMLKGEQWPDYSRELWNSEKRDFLLFNFTPRELKYAGFILFKYKEKDEKN